MTRTSPAIARAAILTGMLVSAVGDNLASIALDLHAAAIGSSAFLACLLVGQTAPGVVLGLAGGVLADTALRWWVWPSSLAAQGLLFAVMTTSDSSVLLVAGITVISVIAALTGSVATKLMAHYSNDATRSGGHMATVMGLSQAIGVALGGIGFATVGAHTLLAINAGTFTVFAALAWATSTRESIELDATSPRDGKGALLGFRRLSEPTGFGHAGLAVIIATVMGTSIEGVVGMFVLTRQAHLPTATVGLVVAAWGLGVMAAGALLPQFQGVGRVSDRLVMACSSVVIGVVFITVALALPPAPAIVGLFALGGMANGVFNTRLVAVIIGSVPGSEQGRVWAAFRWITAVCFLIGYVIGGLLGVTHAVPAMVLSGTIAAAAGVAGIYTALQQPRP